MKKEGARSKDIRVTHIWVPIKLSPFNFCVAVGK